MYFLDIPCLFLYLEEMKKYLSTKEVAEYFGISFRTVIRWIKVKRLMAINVGSENQPKYRIRDSDLARFETEEYEKNGFTGEN